MGIMRRSKNIMDMIVMDIGSTKYGRMCNILGIILCFERDDARTCVRAYAESRRYVS